MIQELTYAGFTSPRAADWKTHGPGLLGAMLVPDGPDGATRLAIDDVDYRLAIRPGDTDEFGYAGWGLANETDLHRYASLIEQAGITVTQGEASLCAERQVSEPLWFTDPWGTRHELT